MYITDERLKKAVNVFDEGVDYFNDYCYDFYYIVIDELVTDVLPVYKAVIDSFYELEELLLWQVEVLHKGYHGYGIGEYPYTDKIEDIAEIVEELHAMSEFVNDFDEWRKRVIILDSSKVDEYGDKIEWSIEARDAFFDCHIS